MEKWGAFDTDCTNVFYRFNHTISVEEAVGYKGIYMLNNKLFLIGSTGFILSYQPMTDDMIKMVNFIYPTGITIEAGFNPNTQFPGTEWTSSDSKYSRTV